MKREFSKLPSAETVKEFEGLAELIEEHQKVLSALRKNKSEYEQLELERQRARSKDGKARVDAYRSGKADPGASHEAKVLAKIEALRDNQSVLEAAYVAVEKDISVLVSHKRGEWLPKVEDLVRDDDEELAVLLEQARDVIKRRQNHVGLHEWMLELAPACTPKVFAEHGQNENMALNFLLSTIGKTIKVETDEVEAIGA